MEIQLPECWSRISPRVAEELVDELRRELSNKHALYGLEAEAVARSDFSDDVLFKVTEAPLPYYWVHLTWKREMRADWPSAEGFPTIEEFAAAWNEAQVHWKSVDS